MTEKFAIKEAWWLDKNGDKREKVIFLNPDEVFGKQIKKEDVRGDKGNVVAYEYQVFKKEMSIKRVNYKAI